MSARAAWIAVPLGLLNVALAMLGLLFAGLNGYSLIRFLEEQALATSILAVSVSVVGMIIAAHRPRNPLGWIFLAIGFTQSLVNLEPAPIGGQLFAHEIYGRDCTAF